MRKLIIVTILLFSAPLFALSPWLESLDDTDKQQQLNLRWQASGGQADLKFMYDKLQSMGVQVSPAAKFPNKHWTNNHLVFPISQKNKLELQVPYGNIEKVTSGSLAIDADFTLTSGIYQLKVNSFKLVPTESPLNKSDIVTFKFIDQNNHHLFTIDSVHIEYDKAKGLLLMSNMDLFATNELAKLLHNPNLTNQIVGQIHTYNKLAIPENAKTELKGNVCGTGPGEHPVWPPEGEIDVLLSDIGSIQWVRNVGGDRIVIAPSARLKNIGTAEVPWYQQFTSPQAPYNNDQHPFLNWAVYREIDGRFEQLSVSGVKHAFLTINSNCTINCSDNHILWLGCEDVYGVGNNDDPFSLGPRDEIEADGIWDNCNSFFDPGCTGGHTNDSDSVSENRVVVQNSEITDPNNTQLFMQAWYLIRDDINIFNSMGYRSIDPTFSGGAWFMNAGNDFTNGAALDNYVTPNTMAAMQSSQTVDTGEGQVTVAVKVVDLGGGLYRYNYAVENYEFDPRFDQFIIGLPSNATMTDTVFSDPDNNLANDWVFTRVGNQLKITGSSNNELDWAMLFSFSFTTNIVPQQRFISLKAANTPTNPSNAIINVLALSTDNLPDPIFDNSFE